MTQKQSIGHNAHKNFLTRNRVRNQPLKYVMPLSNTQCTKTLLFILSYKYQTKINLILKVDLSILIYKLKPVTIKGFKTLFGIMTILKIFSVDVT